MPYQLYVFGSNGEGQLGIPAAEIVNIPTIATSWPVIETISTIRTGDNHTIFLTPAGQVFVAGDARKGQLGNRLVQQGRLERIEKLYGSIHHCAATCESSAYIANVQKYGGGQEAGLTTEGTSHWGEIGISAVSTTIGYAKEEFQQTLTGAVVDIAAGGWHYVALLDNGEAWGWGKSRLEQLGANLCGEGKVSKPTRIEEEIGFVPVKAVCGKEFTYLVSSPAEGKHCLFGRDKFGLRSKMPVEVKHWKQVGATWNSIFVLLEDGTLTAWGKDNLWKLVPDGLPLIEKIAVGSEHVLALTREGKLISWGWGKHGNCGDLGQLGDRVKGDMVSGFWNDISLPGQVEFLGAGFCTSFVLVKRDE